MRDVDLVDRLCTKRVNTLQAAVAAYVRISKVNRALRKLPNTSETVISLAD